MRAHNNIRLHIISFYSLAAGVVVADCNGLPVYVCCVLCYAVSLRLLLCRVYCATTVYESLIKSCRHFIVCVNDVLLVLLAKVGIEVLNRFVSICMYGTVTRVSVCVCAYVCLSRVAKWPSTPDTLARVKSQEATSTSLVPIAHSVQGGGGVRRAGKLFTTQNFLPHKTFSGDGQPWFWLLALRRGWKMCEPYAMGIRLQFASALVGRAGWIFLFICFKWPRSIRFWWTTTINLINVTCRAMQTNRIYHMTGIPYLFDCHALLSSVRSLYSILLMVPHCVLRVCMAQRAQPDRGENDTKWIYIDNLCGRVECCVSELWTQSHFRGD